FSKVSRTCFCTSSSLGSSFGVWLLPFLLSPLLFLNLLLPFLAVSLLMRRRLPFLSFVVSALASFFFSGFLNWVRSILSPVKFGPSNLRYWVVTVSEVLETSVVVFSDSAEVSFGFASDFSVFSFLEA